MTTTIHSTLSNILSHHFSFVDENRLHKNKVLSIFKLYVPNMTITSLNAFLSQLHIQYNNSLREFGDKQKGVYIGLDIINTSKSDNINFPVTFIPDGLKSYRGKPLSINTIDTWQARIKKLSLLGLDEALQDQNYDKIVSIITNESKSLDTICTSITAILNLMFNTCDNSNEQEQEHHMELVKKLVALRKQYKQKKDKQRCQNKLSPKEEKAWVDWDEVITKFKEQTDIRKKLVLGLYCIQFPRRIQDYDEMYYVKEEPSDETKNYYFVTNGTGNFIFNKYKTSYKYKKQTIAVHGLLQKIISSYLSLYNIKYGQRLLGNINIRDILYEIFNKNVGVGILRKSFLTALHELNLTTAELENIATLMAHSVHESLRYKKVLQ